MIFWDGNGSLSVVLNLVTLTKKMNIHLIILKHHDSEVQFFSVVFSFMLSIIKLRNAVKSDVL